MRRSVPYFEGVHDGFLHRKTGDVQIEDLRHGLFPTGWRIVCYKCAGDKVVSNKYANDRTGELTFFDPQMAPETLRARGINIRDFRLL